MVWHPWRALGAETDWRLEYADLPDGVLGFTDVRRRLITLATGLTQAERRCTLTHELVHVWRLDQACTPAVEALVEEAAARLLIPIDALVDACRWTDSAAELAELLWVDQAILRVRAATLHPAERAAVAAVIAERSPVA